MRGHSHLADFYFILWQHSFGAAKKMFCFVFASLALPALLKHQLSSAAARPAKRRVLFCLIDFDIYLRFFVRSSSACACLKNERIQFVRVYFVNNRVL